MTSVYWGTNDLDETELDDAFYSIEFEFLAALMQDYKQNIEIFKLMIHSIFYIKHKQ